MIIEQFYNMLTTHLPLWDVEWYHGGTGEEKKKRKQFNSLKLHLLYQDFKLFRLWRV